VTPISNWKRIVRIVDETFTRHERALVILRKDTIHYLHQQLRNSAEEQSSHRPRRRIPAVGRVNGPIRTG